MGLNLNRGFLMSKTVDEHRAISPKNLAFAVLTVSTSRAQKLAEGSSFTDPSGDALTDLLEKIGQKVVFRKIIADDKTSIASILENILSRRDIDVVITCGGTGIAASDVTIETIEPLFTKTLPGFGELMRKISYEDIGSAAILTRAIAGTAGNKVIFCIPGSPQAVVTAMRLIIPEVSHIVKHVREN
jgi:molybdopterin adenylyltransferase